MQLQMQLDNSKRQYVEPDQNEPEPLNNSKLTSSFASRRSRFSNDYISEAQSLADETRSFILKSKASIAASSKNKKKKSKKGGLSKKTSVHSARLLDFHKINKSSRSIEPDGIFRRPRVASDIREPLMQRGSEQKLKEDERLLNINLMSRYSNKKPE